MDGRLKDTGEAMKCTICKHGETAEGFATVTLHRGRTVVVFRDVPAQVCQVCGEYYLEGEISETLLEQAEDAVSRGVEIDVRNFVASESAA